MPPKKQSCVIQTGDTDEDDILNHVRKYLARLMVFERERENNQDSDTAIGEARVRLSEFAWMMHLDAVIDYDSTVICDSTVYMLACRTAEGMSLDTALKMSALWKGELAERDSGDPVQVQKGVDEQSEKTLREITYGLVKEFGRS